MDNKDYFKDYVFTDDDYNAINDLVEGKVKYIVINGLKLMYIHNSYSECNKCIFRNLDSTQFNCSKIAINCNMIQHVNATTLFNDHEFTDNNYKELQLLHDGKRQSVTIGEVELVKSNSDCCCDCIFNDCTTINCNRFTNCYAIKDKDDYITNKIDNTMNEKANYVSEANSVPNDSIKDVEDISDHTRFERMCIDMCNTHKAKNADYGNSFSKLYQEFGIVSAVTRMFDKMFRIKTLMNKEPEVVNESVRDTLLDLANYAIMTIIELDKENKDASTK